jgi:hypothetical protein
MLAVILVLPDDLVLFLLEVLVFPKCLGLVTHLGLDSLECPQHWGPSLKKVSNGYLRFVWEMGIP